ncbi:MAG TPA: bifunctional nicotinamidase/pyrazinamidase [Burkholderiales bacterium]|nr:bifunctional nicotinamidase/pyrazinamidase [Burkholderiales bacterium]
MPKPTDCLLVVDVQNDFCPGGALAVKRGDEIVPLVNQLARRFQNVVITQDWHPPGHVSFASSHPGKKPFETKRLRYGEQVMWPDHCVQGTHGAALHEGLDIPHAQLVIRKGFHPKVDSYSGFLEADRETKTGLDGYLKSRGVKRAYCVGLATDFCVAWTALDARKFGLDAVVLEDACRAIDNAGSLDAAWKAMQKAGVKRSNSSAVLRPAH